jgi:error-prone DNA polymerase
MVHPYLRRREGKERPNYPSAALERVLGKTLGVPLFQEQAMQVAIVCAGFTPGEADQLRRSMSTFKLTGGVSHFRVRLIEGMVANGYERDFAERMFAQLEGFGSYGFPESHAASFALIAYASAWLKCRHPDVFCCALLNSQPMGFYAPAQVVRDACEHGVEVRSVCVNASRWDCTLEPASSNGGGALCLAVRLGLRMVGGLANADGARLVAERGEVPYGSVEAVWRRAGVPAATLERLAGANAFAGLGLDRRAALWAVRGLANTALPLFAAAERDGVPGPEAVEPEVALAPLPAGGEVVEDYRSTGLSLRQHPVAFLREDLRARGMGRPAPTWLLRAMAAASPCPAWCSCASGQARRAALCSSRSRTRPAWPTSWSGPACSSASAGWR